MDCFLVTRGRRRDAGLEARRVWNKPANIFDPVVTTRETGRRPRNGRDGLNARFLFVDQRGEAADGPGFGEVFVLQPATSDDVTLRNTCAVTWAGYFTVMLSTELSRTALELPTADRLELARRLVESVVEPAPLTAAVKEGIRRIEEVATGRVAGLTEEQYRTAVR